MADESPSVLTPLNFEPMVALGNKLWRKEIIREGPLYYLGGKLDITPAYLDAIHAAYQDNAIGSVPVVGVNKAGEHDESTSMERWKGNVIGLERTANGLAAICELGDDADQLVRNTKKKLGVSVLVKHNRTTGGGKKYAAVLGHVAATFDPVINDLADWEEVAASQGDGGPVLALTADPVVAPEDSSAPRQDAPQPTKEITVADTDTLSPEDVASLRSLASLAPQLAALLKGGEGGNTEAEPEGPVLVDDTTDTETDEAEFTDAEIEAMAASLTDADVAELVEPELVAASHSDTDVVVEGPSEEVLALTQQLRDAEEAGRDRDLRLAQVEQELAAKNYAAERDTWAREFGIHPAVTDIIRPLIEGRGVGQVALSHSQTRVDVAETVRKFAKALASRPRLDLSQAVGSPLDVDDTAEDKRQRDLTDFLTRARAELNG